MRRILICTGVLGGGTAIVFALAGLTALAFPQGSVVASGWNGGWSKGVMVEQAPMPAPVVMPAPEITIDQVAPDMTVLDEASSDVESPRP